MAIKVIILLLTLGTGIVNVQTYRMDQRSHPDWVEYGIVYVLLLAYEIMSICD